MDFPAGVVATGVVATGVVATGTLCCAGAEGALVGWALAVNIGWFGLATLNAGIARLRSF